MFPNPYLVYLHDTPSQALFDQADRAFSSGCVRVERALELAQHVLNDAQRWNQDAITRVIASGKLQNVTLKSKMPVLLAYWTAWVDQQRIDQFSSRRVWAGCCVGPGLNAPFRVRARPLFADAHQVRIR